MASLNLSHANTWTALQTFTRAGGVGVGNTLIDINDSDNANAGWKVKTQFIFGEVMPNLVPVSSAGNAYGLIQGGIFMRGDVTLGNNPYLYFIDGADENIQGYFWIDGAGTLFGASTTSNFVWNGSISLGSTPQSSATGLWVHQTTEQMRIGYNSSNYWTTTVGVAGIVTFDAVGASASFIFSDDVSVPDEVYGAGWNGSLEVPTKNAVYDKLQLFAAGTGIDHGGLTGLGDDDHTQYALLLGRSGGQALIGGTASGNNLTLQSTSHATKGKLIFGTSAYDEVNDRLGIGTASPSVKLHVITTTEQFRVGYDASNYFSTTVSSTGVVTFDAAGSGSSFIVNDKFGVYISPAAAVNIGSHTSGYGTIDLFTSIRAISSTAFALSGNGSSETILNVASGGTLSFRINASAVGTWSSTGLGIGVSAIAKLHAQATTEQLRLSYDASNYFSTTVGSTGIVTFNAVGAGSSFIFSDSVDIQSSLRADSIVNDTGLAHGTYTPTLTNTTNVAASTARQCTYMRVGNTVTVAGQFDIDPTAPASATLMGISLPVASNFSTAYQLGGTACATGIAGQSAGIEADATNDRASVKFISSDISNQPMTFTFSYQVI